jgi:hypothetical protein
MNEEYKEHPAYKDSEPPPEAEWPEDYERAGFISKEARKEYYQRLLKQAKDTGDKELEEKINFIIENPEVWEKRGETIKPEFMPWPEEIERVLKERGLEKNWENIAKVRQELLTNPDYLTEKIIMKRFIDELTGEERPWRILFESEINPGYDEKNKIYYSQWRTELINLIDKNRTEGKIDPEKLKKHLKYFLLGAAYLEKTEEDRIRKIIYHSDEAEKEKIPISEDEEKFRLGLTVDQWDKLPTEPEKRKEIFDLVRSYFKGRDFCDFSVLESIALIDLVEKGQLKIEEVKKIHEELMNWVGRTAIKFSRVYEPPTTESIEKIERKYDSKILEKIGGTKERGEAIIKLIKEETAKKISERLPFIQKKREILLKEILECKKSGTEYKELERRLKELDSYMSRYGFILDHHNRYFQPRKSTKKTKNNHLG